MRNEGLCSKANFPRGVRFLFVHVLSKQGTWVPCVDEARNTSASMLSMARVHASVLVARGTTVAVTRGVRGRDTDTQRR